LSSVGIGSSILGQAGVDQQMMVAGLLLFDAGGCNAHADEAEADRHRPLDRPRRSAG
jgi:hypothetical protein